MLLLTVCSGWGVLGLPLRTVRSRPRDLFLVVVGLCFGSRVLLVTVQRVEYQVGLKLWADGHVIDGQLALSLDLVLGLALDRVSFALRVFPLTMRVVNAWFSPPPITVEGLCFRPVGRHSLLCWLATEPRRLCRVHGYLADVSQKTKILLKHDLFNKIGCLGRPFYSN